MNAAIEIGKIMDAAIANATPAESPTDMERARRHAHLVVQQETWLCKALVELDVEPEMRAVAQAALLDRATLRVIGRPVDALAPLLEAIEDLRARLIDIAYEEAMGDAP